MNYKEIVRTMSEAELAQRIQSTGSKEFKTALEDELKTRTGSIIEGTVVEQPESVQEKSLEETNTNTKVEDKEPETVAVEAPKPKRTRRSKTTN